MKPKSPRAAARSRRAGVLWIIVAEKVPVRVRHDDGSFRRPWYCEVMDGRGAVRGKALAEVRVDAVRAAVASAGQDGHPTSVAVDDPVTAAVVATLVSAPRVELPPRFDAQLDAYARRLIGAVPGHRFDPLGRGELSAETIARLLTVAAELHRALPREPERPMFGVTHPDDEDPTAVVVVGGATPSVLMFDPLEADQMLDDLDEGRPPAVRHLALVYRPLDQSPPEEQAFLRAHGWELPVAVAVRETDFDGVAGPRTEGGMRRLHTVARLLLAAGMVEQVQGHEAERELAVVGPPSGLVHWIDPGIADLDVDGDVLELEISLDDVEPAVTRRLEVRGGMTLGQLHVVLQGAMGWEGYHAHDFQIGRTRYAPADVDSWGDVRSLDEEVRLDSVLRAGLRFTYTYDFGDGWQHSIRVAKVRPAAADTPAARCTGGARACPPEDCGGPPGYAELCAALADPSHPEHADRVEWAPDGFDPEAFDPAAATRNIGVHLRMAAEAGDDEPIPF